jgi:signal transduction histidine kinase
VQLTRLVRFGEVLANLVASRISSRKARKAERNLSLLTKLSWKRQLVPVLGFGLPLAAIAFTQYRWLGEIRKQSLLIESQSNRATAAAAIEVLKSEMNAARLNFLPGVVHADVVRGNLDALARQFDDAHRRYPYVDRFFVWAAPSSARQTLFYLFEERRFVHDPELLKRFPRFVWNRNPQSRRWAEYRASGDGPPLQIVVHRVVDLEDTGDEGVVGFTVDLERFSRETLPEFFRARMLPLLNGEGASGEPVAFLGERGECLLGFPECFAVGKLGAAIDLPASFGLPIERLPGVEGPPLWRFAVDEPKVGFHEGLRVSALGNLAVVGLGMLALAAGVGLIARSMTREAELSDLKSRFISGISHELKTPLSLIRLYSEMLELGRVKREDRLDFYRRLRQQSEALGDMLEEILDFSRLEAEQRSLHKETCSPREILEEAIDMLTAHGTVPREVTLSVDEELPSIEADRRGLVRAVYNLLDNALKYSPPEHPIRVRAERRNGSVALEVEDRGNGLEEDEIPRIFDRFYRGRAARSNSIQGTGLGLSIAETVVKAHEGRIEVETTAGEGCRFTILLPWPAS